MTAKKEQGQKLETLEDQIKASDKEVAKLEKKLKSNSKESPEKLKQALEHNKALMNQKEEAEKIIAQKNKEIYILEEKFFEWMEENHA